MADKILIVDDDNDTVVFLRTLLDRQGYQTVIARDGIDALEKANRELPDLIILDVMLPRMDGFEVARSLHRHAETALIPILMFTAKAQIEDKKEGYEAGVDLYLTKPVLPMELQSNIKALLIQHKTRISAMAERGYVVGVLSAKGGQGVSTVTLNTAISYSHLKKGRVIAVEMRPGQGTWADELNILPVHTLDELLKMNAVEITQTVVESYLTTVKYGIRLLFGGGSVSDVNLSASINQYEDVVRQLAEISNIIFLDIGPAFGISLPAILELCDEIIVVTEPQILAVRRTVHLLEDLRKQGFGSVKALSLVSLNHTRADSILSVSQIEAETKQSVALGFPPAPELAARAIQSATPLVVFQPDALVSLQFAKLVDIISKHLGK